MQQLLILIDKYFTFTLAFLVLSAALYIFKDNKELVYMVIGIFGGIISNPIIAPKNKNENKKDEIL